MDITNVKIIERTIFLKNIAVLMIFATEWRLVLSGKSINHAPQKVDARRDLPFGITYPYGYHPATTTAQYPPTLTYPVFTIIPWMTKAMEELFSFSTSGTRKSPPTLFFPGVSSPVTVTEFPLPLVYLDPKTEDNPCQLYIRDCLRGYDTGYLCGKAMYNTYFTFNNYCAMEYANCQSKTTMWQVAYFGNCQIPRLPNVGEDFAIDGENFLEAAIINAPPFDPMKGKQEEY